MKNRILLLLVSFYFVSNSQSKILESKSMTSKLLNTSVKYSVYLPNGFKSTKKYPVIYLLNGFTGNETDWIKSGMVKDITDELIRGNKIEPVVIIMPDGDDRLYMNLDDGSYPYEDMFIKELMPYVENKYNIKSQKNYRALSGLSMGGAGSLRLALKYNNLFGACAAFSAAIVTDNTIEYAPQRQFDNYFAIASVKARGKKGKERLTPNIKEYNTFSLLDTIAKEKLKSVDIYFDCGDDDFLTIGNSTMHIELTKKGIPHEYRVRDGGHTWNYWVTSLPIGLQFIGNSFKK